MSSMKNVAKISFVVRRKDFSTPFDVIMVYTKQSTPLAVNNSCDNIILLLIGEQSRMNSDYYITIYSLFSFLLITYSLLQLLLYDCGSTIPHKNYETTNIKVYLCLLSPFQSNVACDEQEFLLYSFSSNTQHCL